MSQSKAINCYYLKDVCKKTKDNTKGYEGFGEIGSRWVRLGICLMCAHVRCCNSSIKKHGTKHFNKNHDPITSHKKQVRIGNDVMLMKYSRVTL